MLARFTIIALALIFSLSANASDLPDPTRTPGALNPDVTQENIHSTISG